MEINLHIEQLETERRWNRLHCFERQFRPSRGTVLGRFLSFGDDNTFVWLHGFSDRASNGEIPQSFVRESVVRTLTPAIGSTIQALEDFARMKDPVLEVRHYRVEPGTRDRFATFLRDRTMEEHKKLGMTVYGPFNVAGEDDVLTWFRGFPSLIERDRRKAAFYQGPYWLNELEDEAFSMIADYSVLLVTPV